MGWGAQSKKNDETEGSLKSPSLKACPCHFPLATSHLSLEDVAAHVGRWDPCGRIVPHRRTVPYIVRTTRPVSHQNGRTGPSSGRRRENHLIVASLVVENSNGTCLMSVWWWYSTNTVVQYYQVATPRWAQPTVVRRWFSTSRSTRILSYCSELLFGLTFRDGEGTRAWVDSACPQLHPRWQPWEQT